jgi:hypothetical protein
MRWTPASGPRRKRRRTLSKNQKQIVVKKEVKPAWKSKGKQAISMIAGFSYNAKRKQLRIPRPLYKTVANIVKKIGINNYPKQRFHRTNYAQVIVPDVDRKSHTITLMDWDGDIKATVYPNTKFYDFNSGNATGQKLIQRDAEIDNITDFANFGNVKINLDQAWRKITYRNNGLHDVKAYSYIIVPKMDLSESIENCWASDLGSDVTHRQTTSIVEADIIKTVGLFPEMSVDFHKKFKILAKRVIYCKPGETFSAFLRVSRKTLDVAQLALRSAEITGDLNFVKGLTKAHYCIFEPTIGHSAAAPTSVGRVGTTMDIESVLDFTIRFNPFAASTLYAFYDNPASFADGQQASIAENLN